MDGGASSADDVSDSLEVGESVEDEVKKITSAAQPQMVQVVHNHFYYWNERPLAPSGSVTRFQEQSLSAADEDLRRCLSRNKKLLRKSGWYYGRLSHTESFDLLKNSCAGTFLVRDSSDRSCIYSLSLQRNPEEEGPTSIRIQFSDGQFRLDSDKYLGEYQLIFVVANWHCKHPKIRTM